MKRMTLSLGLLIAFSLAINSALAAPQSRPARRPGLRALTFENGVSFFREALGRRPVKVDARIAIFAEGEWKNRNVYNHCVIFLENADEDLQITFVMSGDEGMNWVNEFFDSQFFNRRETEALFALLNRGLGQHRANIGRFRVELSRWEPHHHEIVVLSLTPRR
jgi:hypothetical protein